MRLILRNKFHRTETSVRVEPADGIHKHPWIPSLRLSAAERRLCGMDCRCEKYGTPRDGDGNFYEIEFWESDLYIDGRLIPGKENRFHYVYLAGSG
jgi:hypothetical protein